jgi:UDP-glucose 4-epimerase
MDIHTYESEFEMSKIVITGGAGFIGSHIAEHLPREYEIIICDNLDNYYSLGLKKRNLDLILKNRNARFIEGDVTDLAFVKEVIDSDVEFVYHEAAQAGVQISIEDPFKSNNSNVLGTLNVLKASLDSGVKRVINASSSSVYGKVQYLPFDEAHPTQPVSPYGVSKLAAEHYCRVFFEVYGLPTISLRYFTVYGPRMRPDLAISIFTGKMLKNEPVTIFGDGEKTRDFTYIEDVVWANKKLLTTAKGDGTVMNIGGGSGISIINLAQHLKEITSSRSEILFAGSKKGDAEHTLADTKRAKELIGFEPVTPIWNGLRKYVEWYERVT